jgi:hypothetical protein
MEIRPVSPVEQGDMHIAATTRKLTMYVPDRIKTLNALRAIADHKANQLDKRRRKNKVAKASRRQNRSR